TPLSNLEATSNYQDIQDPAITVRFRLKEDLGAGGPVDVLAWTTTPWTLPENLGLCVGPDIDYEIVEDADPHQRVVIPSQRVAAYNKKPDQYESLRKLKGRDLAGLHYEPLLPFFADQPNAFRILVDDFVSTGDGTGVVHMAPAYGEDDYRICRREKIDL